MGAMPLLRMLFRQKASRPWGAPTEALVALVPVRIATGMPAPA